MPSDQNRKIEQVKFTYSHLGKGFEKQTKTIEVEIKSVEGDFQKEMRTNELKNKIDEIKKLGRKN